MKLTLQRRPSSSGATLGQLFINDVFFCFTLEDVDRQLEANPAAKVFGQTAIPRGTYQVIIDWSPHFQRELPHVLNVPGFNGIRIHSGNAPADTDGCVLVGSSIVSPNFIGNSRATLSLLIARIDAAFDRGDSVMLEVV